MNFELIDVVDVKATLGEGVVWDHRTGEGLWTDIESRRFYRYDLSARKLDHIELDERLTALGLSTDPDWLIAAFETGFAWLHRRTGERRWLERPEKGATGKRFNDGRVGPCGRFWCGTMVEDADKAGAVAGSLYCLDRENKVSTALGGVAISNSLAWSPDGRIMYFADSPKRVIWAFDYDPETGGIGNKRVFAETPKGVYPDGAAVDAEGCLWSAQWGGARIARYSVDGALMETLTVPASQPSCVAFGGPGLDFLFVTTARENLTPEALAAEPRAGDILIYKTACKGIPSEVFGGRPPSPGKD